MHGNIKIKFISPLSLNTTEAQYPIEHIKTKHKTLAQCCQWFSNRSLLPTAPGKESDTLATKWPKRSQKVQHQYIPPQLPQWKQLRHSSVHSPSQEAYSHWCGQAIVCHLWNLNIQYYVHNTCHWTLSSTERSGIKRLKHLIPHHTRLHTFPLESSTNLQCEDKVLCKLEVRVAIGLLDNRAAPRIRGAVRNRQLSFIELAVVH